jgi:hypothetical protein
MQNIILPLGHNATPNAIVPVRSSFYGLLPAVSACDTPSGWPVILYLADFNVGWDQILLLLPTENHFECHKM